MEPKGFEPSTSALRTQELSNVSEAIEQLATTVAAVCTRVCTSNPKAVHTDLLESLAAALRNSLPASARRQLVDLIITDMTEDAEDC